MTDNLKNSLNRSVPKLSNWCATMCVALSMTAGGVTAEEARTGYDGTPRTLLWSPGPLEFFDAAEFKKEPPYTIGFSNASISNIWRVGLQHSLQKGIADNKSLVEKFYITDANDDPGKQVSDVQDLLERDVDILIVSAATADALDRIVTSAMKRGVPVVMVDRRISSDNFVSFVTASDYALGRFQATWIAETLGGKGNVIMLPGGKGASPAEIRLQAAMSVFNQYPGIKVLDTQYTDWSPAKGKTVTSAMIQRFGDDIDAIWAGSGLQGSGAIEAFVDAGYEDGAIPPVTCGDLNGCVKLAVQHKIPAMSFDYPPSMGYKSVEIALDVLAGKTVPKIFEINADISVSKGHETQSVKADRWVEDIAKLDRPNELILSTGLGDDYDPNTFDAGLGD